MPHPDLPDQREDHDASQRDPSMSTLAVWAVMIGLAVVWGVWSVFGAGSGR